MRSAFRISSMKKAPGSLCWQGAGGRGKQEKADAGEMPAGKTQAMASASRLYCSISIIPEMISSFVTG